MSDFDEEHELSTDEAARLRALLQRAADGVEVPPTPQPSAMPADAAGPVRAGRRVWIPVAAVVVLVAAVAAGWLLRGGSGADIDAGPADGPVVEDSDEPAAVSATVLEQSGVWRLPQDLDGYDLVAGSESNVVDRSLPRWPGELAVDDPADPRHWVMVEALDRFAVDPESSRCPLQSVELICDIIPPTSPDGPTWFQIEPIDGATPVSVVSGATYGVETQDLIAALDETYRGQFDIILGLGFADSAETVIDRIGPTGGEREPWGYTSPHADDLIPMRPATELTLTGTTGEAVVFMVDGSDKSAWVQLLLLDLQASLSRNPLPAGRSSPGSPPESYFEEEEPWWGSEYTLTRRPDLGRNVAEMAARRPGMPEVTSLVVITDDGVTTSTQRKLIESDVADPLSIDEQLRIINSLRSVSPEEFRRVTTELNPDESSEFSETTVAAHSSGD